MTGSNRGEERPHHHRHHLRHYHHYHRRRRRRQVVSTSPLARPRYSSRINNIPRLDILFGIRLAGRTYEQTRPVPSSSLSSSSSSNRKGAHFRARVCTALAERSSVPGPVYTMDNGGQESEGRTCDYVPA